MTTAELVEEGPGLVSECRFFHVDRAKSLRPGQVLDLNPDKLSRFGATYVPAFRSKHPDQFSVEELREWRIEQVRTKVPIFAQNRPSRFQCLFAALTVEDAKCFAELVKPPSTSYNILEVFAREFFTLDMNWLDFSSATENYLKSYWYGEISNHRPTLGERRAPMLEVLIVLPARVGKVLSST